MRVITMSCSKLNALGCRGENLATQARFPVVNKFRQLFGEGTFQLLVLRQGDEQPYAVSTEVDGADVVWNLTSTDTAKAGYASAELQYYAADVLAKSIQYGIRIAEALGEPAEEPPEVWVDWVQQVLAVGTEVEAFLAVTESGETGQVWTKSDDGARWADPQGGGGAGSWDTLQGKPFSRIGETLAVEDGTLEVNIHEVSNEAGGLTTIIG